MAIPVDSDLLEIGYRLNEKLIGLDLDSLDLSTAGLDYYKYNAKKLKYVQQLNVKILQELLVKLKKPLDQLTIIDHGGGLGFWSFLLKEAGIGTVIYHDINEHYLQDLEKIGRSLGLMPDHICMGDSGALVSFCEENNLFIDGLGSRNVIEHIPDLEYFFDNLAKLPGSNVVAVISTSANIHNPLVRWQHRKHHRKIENIGLPKSKMELAYERDGGMKSQRARLIREYAPSLSDSEVRVLAELTRGYFGQSFEKAIRNFKEDTIWPTPISDPTNTCNPITGAWAERLVPFSTYRQLCEKVKFKAHAITGFYNEGYTSKIQRFVAKIINKIIGLLPGVMLTLSPYLMFRINKE